MRFIAVVAVLLLVCTTSTGVHIRDARGDSSQDNDGAVVLNNFNHILNNNAAGGSDTAPGIPSVSSVAAAAAAAATAPTVVGQASPVIPLESGAASSSASVSVPADPNAKLQKKLDNWLKQEIAREKVEAKAEAKIQQKKVEKAAAGTSCANQKASCSTKKLVSRLAASKYRFSTSVHFMEGPDAFRLFDYWSKDPVEWRVNPGRYTEEWKSFPKAFAKFKQAVKRDQVTIPTMKLKLLGYSSKIEAGSDAAALTLAKKRAKSVACYVGSYVMLSMKLKRLQLDVMPIGVCSSSQCLAQDAKNRRVDIVYGPSKRVINPVVSYVITNGQPDAAFASDCIQNKDWMMKSGWNPAWMGYSK